MNLFLEIKLNYLSKMRKTVDNCKKKHNVSNCSLCGDVRFCHTKIYEYEGHYRIDNNELKEAEP